jgi:hypothetical protein
VADGQHGNDQQQLLSRATLELGSAKIPEDTPPQQQLRLTTRAAHETSVHAVSLGNGSGWAEWLNGKTDEADEGGGLISRPCQINAHSARMGG